MLVFMLAPRFVLCSSVEGNDGVSLIKGSDNYPYVLNSYVGWVTSKKNRKVWSGYTRLSEQFKEQGCKHYFLALPNDAINYHHG